jgi:hypothetical protein
MTRPRLILLWIHKTYMTYLPVTYTDLAIEFITFVFRISQQPATRCTTPFAFALFPSFLLVLLFMIIKTRTTSEMSVTVVTRNSPICVWSTRGNGSTVTTDHIALMCHNAPTTLITSVTDVPLCHISRKIGNHMIMT